MTKKTLIIVAVVFLGSFAITYSFLKKEKGAKINISNYIPISNNGVVGAFNYVAIEDIVQTELFRNPLELLDMKNNFKGNKFVADLMSALIQGGIDKNQKIIFFISKKPKSGSFLLIAIDDFKRLKKKIKSNLKEHQHQELKIAEDVYGVFSKQEEVGIVLNKNMVLIASGAEKEIKKLWGSIASKTNCYAENTAGIDSLVNNKHHISVWIDNNGLVSSFNQKNEEVFAHVDFLDGKLLMNSTVVAKTADMIKPSTIYPCDSCAVNFHLNMKNLNTFYSLLSDSISLKLDSAAQLLNVDVPQFLKLSNGKIDAVVIDKGVRKEKVITYEFDDDFNKVEKEKVHTFPIVNFIMTLGSDTGEMYHQFKKKGLIKMDDKEELFTNPIGKCFVKNEENGMQLTSNQDLFNKIIKEEKSNQPLFLKADIEKLLKIVDKQDSIKKQPFKMLLCNAYQKDSLITFQVELTSKEKTRNILFDLAEGVLLGNNPDY